MLGNFFYLGYIAMLFAHRFILERPIVPSRPGILTESIYAVLPIETTAAHIIAMVLLFVQAFFINEIVSRNKLIADVGLFPGLFYLLVANLAPEFSYLSPALIANTFYLAVIYNLFLTYNNSSAAPVIFNIGFFISTASLFYFSYFSFILLGVVGLNALRTLNGREQIMMLCGAVVPYLILSTYFFWFDQLSSFLNQQLHQNIKWFSLEDKLFSSQENIIILSAIGFLIVVTLASYNNNIFKKVREVQKKINLFYWMLLIPAISLLFQAQIQTDHSLIIAVPLGILLSFSFSRLSSSWAELYHLFLLATLLFFQYKTLILSL